jgi:hypothetical protein
MLYLAILTFLLLLSSFSFAQTPQSVSWPSCNETFVEGKHAPHNLKWVRPSDLLVQIISDSYRIVQTFNSYGQSPCRVAAYMLSTCNNGSMSFPLVFANFASESSYLVAYQIPEDSPYLFYTPPGSNECKCSSITYSLLAACSGCRGGQWLTYVSSEYSTSFKFTFANLLLVSLNMPLNARRIRVLLQCKSIVTQYLYSSVLTELSPVFLIPFPLTHLYPFGLRWK